MSPKHSRSVALVLNPRTGLVSPQFHVKFDSTFTTVSSQQANASHGVWKGLMGFQKKQINRQSTKLPAKDKTDLQSKETRIQPSEGANVPTVEPMDAGEPQDFNFGTIDQVTDVQLD